MEDNFELLSNGLLIPLKERGVTLINVTNFNNKLFILYNRTHKKKLGKEELLSNNNLYQETYLDYKERLENEVGFKLDFSDMPATIVGEVDCIKIKKI